MALTAQDIAEVDRKIAVMQAYRDGKPIQSRSLSDYPHAWSGVVYPSWEWADYDYRIKPKSRKPREFKLHEVNGRYEVCDRSECTVAAILVREVLPDDAP